MMIPFNATSEVAGGLMRGLMQFAGLARAPAVTPRAGNGSAVEFTGPPGQKSLVLGQDLQQLLGIQGEAPAFGEPDEIPPGRQPRAAVPMRPWMRVQQHHSESVRKLLLRPEVAERLRHTLGVETYVVWHEVLTQAMRLTDELDVRQRNGEIVRDLVPGPQKMLDDALAAVRRRVGPRLPSTTLGTTTRATAKPWRKAGVSTTTTPRPRGPEQQALAYLQWFVREGQMALSRFRPVRYAELPELTAGQVDYRNATVMFRTFPCAPPAMVFPPLEPGGLPLVVYPEVSVRNQPVALQGASVNGTPWLIVCGHPDGGDANTVYTSQDGVEWQRTVGYTNPRVEREKLRGIQLWISQAAFYLDDMHRRRDAYLADPARAAGTTVAAPAGGQD